MTTDFTIGESTGNTTGYVVNVTSQTLIEQNTRIIELLEQLVANTAPKKRTTTNHAKGKKKYGEYKNVLLSDAEHAKCATLYGDVLDGAIRYLDEQIQAKGYKYNDHCLMLCKSDSWVRQNIEQQIMGMSQTTLKQELY